MRKLVLVGAGVVLGAAGAVVGAVAWVMHPRIPLDNREA